MCPPSSSLTILPAGRPSAFFNDELFGKLRLVVGVPDTFVNEGWKFEGLRQGSGKGGTPMVFLNSGFIVKELSSQDHATLLEVTQSYFEHVVGGGTLLCTILLHFQDQATGRLFCVMRNEVGEGPFAVLYDLKGCNDDKVLELDGRKVVPVHKRIWRLHMWCGQCCWSEARRAYYRGKRAAADAEFSVLTEQRAEVLQRIQRDSEWLAGHQLMDYSLLVAVKAEAFPPPPADGASEAAVAAEEDEDVDDPGDEVSPLFASREEDKGRRLVVRGASSEEPDAIMSVSIIDFLQKWTFTKELARGVKACDGNKATIPPAAYARRFVQHFEERFVSSNTAQTLPPLQQAMPPTALAPPAGSSVAMTSSPAGNAMPMDTPEPSTDVLATTVGAPACNSA